MSAVLNVSAFGLSDFLETVWDGLAGVQKGLLRDPVPLPDEGLSERVEVGVGLPSRPNRLKEVRKAKGGYMDFLYLS